MRRGNQKRNSIAICLLLVLVLALAGCKKQPPEPEEVFVPEEEQMQEGEGDAQDTIEMTEPEQPVDAVTVSGEDQNVGFIVLGVGSDESQVSVSWYGKSPNPGKFLVAKASEVDGLNFPGSALAGESAPYAAGYEDYFANQAVVAGLEPDTEYRYMVGNEEGWSAVRSFRTAAAGTLDIIVTGDIQLGTGDFDEQNTADWKRIAADASFRFPDYNMFLNMGDITSIPEDSFYPSVLDTALFTNYPTGVVLGNHDHGAVYQQHFSRPNQSEFGMRNGVQNGNFWFRSGDVLFMELNFMITDLDISVEHRYFIKSALEANPDCKWKVVLMHYSPFSSVAKYQAYSNENRSYWLEVFDEFGIDIVLSGHDHAYTRSHIVKNGQPQVSDAASVTNPDGTLYVTFSSASGSQYHDVSPTGFAAKTLQTYTPHISTINFTDNTFKLTVYEADTWNVLDAFEIVKN